jgi:hypothetical protein
MSLSSVVKKRKKEEVTPEAFLERLEEIKKRKETFFTYISEEEQEEKMPKLQKLFDELRPVIRDALHKANGSAKMKGEALYSFGKFVAAVEFLMALHKLTFDLSWGSSEDLFKKVIWAMEEIIDTYSDIVKGRPLDSITNRLDTLYFMIKDDIKEFLKHLERNIEDLEEHVIPGP